MTFHVLLVLLCERSKYLFIFLLVQKVRLAFGGGGVGEVGGEGLQQAICKAFTKRMTNRGVIN